MKTKNECIPEVINLVEKHHPYDCPECIAVPVTVGNAQYVDWVKEQTTILHHSEKTLSSSDQFMISEITDFWFG